MAAMDEQIDEPDRANKGPEQWNERDRDPEHDGGYEKPHWHGPHRDREYECHHQPGDRGLVGRTLEDAHQDEDERDWEECDDGR